VIWESILQAASEMHWAEVGSVIAGVIYVVLAARENIWCWLFGIAGSALSIYLFYVYKLYAESILYFYYVLAGIYGWWAWTHGRDATEETQMSITTWKPGQHLLTVIVGAGLSLVLAFFLRRYTDAQMPVIDAHTTIFSFLATYLVTRKVLSNWIYWIFIDAISIGLYASRELYLYALLMVAYTLIAGWGYMEWRKVYNSNQELRKGHSG
jgi:nicotinamide mononucleotide transporter